MALRPLPNYLLSNRKRLTLSQEEVAFLLGTGNGQQVCRHERFAREPSLETAFAYEAIYKRNASELFAGLYQKVEQEVAARAKILAEQTKRNKSERLTFHKHQILSDLAGAQRNNILQK
jgi:transcriptional regulator with XRE-family HTH domain